MTELKLTVSQFIDFCNQSLDYAFPSLIVEGEVSSFKINQGKWVFFDLKDPESSISCFMTVSQLNIALEDGMKIQVWATPHLTKWGKFSLTVHRMLPVGQGSIKKSFELLKRKLAAEGLFDPARKRPLPTGVTRVGVISSVNAAGYLDFLKILDNRWGGLRIFTINTQVQGLAASEQIIQALEKFNQQAEVEVIAILRGGGSADDLSAFNDEKLTRAIAASRIPVLTGIGHEIDESLADLAADVRASTPSNAAERLVPDRAAIKKQTLLQVARLSDHLLKEISATGQQTKDQFADLGQYLLEQIKHKRQIVAEKAKTLAAISPEHVLERGYAILRGDFSPGAQLEITTQEYYLTTEVKNVQKRH